VSNIRLTVSKVLALLVSCYLLPTSAVEITAHGLVDMRISGVDSSQESYLVGGQGKFGLTDDIQFSLAHAGADVALIWDNGLSAHSVVNAYIKGSGQGESTQLGITEAYLKYRSLPTESGYRWQTKAGIFYPEISIENNAYAWASKDTLDSSSLNTWIGEEIRVLGAAVKVTRLGRLTGNDYDLSLSATAFVNNDPAGALLAWHGWTTSSRQTLWTESREFAWFPARAEGQALAGQADKSDPFLEIDDRPGYHVRGEVLWRGTGEFSFGYYDNRATPYIVINGQYGWRTRFYHLAARWRINNEFSLAAQYLSGDTLMQSPDQVDVVNNDYANGYIALSYNWRSISKNKKHKTTLRVEDFSVTDNDNTWGDNNNENGQGLTLNHNYRLTKQWFLAAEASVISSERPARYYQHHSVALTERQWQLSARYFF